MKKKYITPDYEVIEFQSEGLIASSDVEVKPEHADNVQFSNKTIWSYNESEAE